MDPKFGIRSATPTDYDAIVAVWTAAGLRTRMQGRDCREAFESQLRQMPGTYRVAEVGGRIIGVVLGTHDSRKGYINRLAVHPEYYRRGVASALIESCERKLTEMGIEIFTALVDLDNDVSCQVFESAGYRRDAPIHYFRKLLRPDI